MCRGLRKGNGDRYVESKPVLLIDMSNHAQFCESEVGGSGDVLVIRVE